MPVTGLNHAVLFVGDVETSRRFYEDALGFRAVFEMPGRAVFLQASGSENDHDLGLFQLGLQAGSSQAGPGDRPGLYHLAWEVDTLAELKRIEGVLAGHGCLVGATDHATTKALYGRDADGIEFEVVWVVPKEHLTQELLDERARMRPLDIDAEIARFGAATPGGSTRYGARG